MPAGELDTGLTPMSALTLLSAFLALLGKLDVLAAAARKVDLRRDCAALISPNRTLALRTDFSLLAFKPETVNKLSATPHQRMFLSAFNKTTTQHWYQVTTLCNLKFKVRTFTDATIFM